jgi:hypothetical protein
MTSTIKVNNVQNQCGQNIINENSNTITIGASGDTIALASGASQTGFGREGSVNWQTGSLKTSTFTAVSGEGYFINQGSAITMNLPAGSAGAIVAVSDYARNFSTYNLTISANGSEKIGGETNDAKLNVDGQAATFVYVDSTKGWVNVQNAEDTETGLAPFITATGGTITTSGDCKIHTFTSPGTFTVCQVAGICAATRNVVSHLVVAGGGAGGTTNNTKAAGGGGGGGYREVKTPLTPYTASPLDGYPSAPNRVTVTQTSFPITVGAGGAAVPSPCTSSGSTGSASTFSTITSAGGGGGGGKTAVGVAGGSGGGAGGGSYGPPRDGGAGNTPPVSPAQGQNGGCSHPGPPDQNSAGGGGAGGTGGQTRPSSNPQGSGGGGGGAGVTTCITASPLGFSGGGAGTGASNGNPNPVGRAGGVGDDGTANSGGAGGGKTSGAGGSGGSGIVVIRYKFQ